MDIKNELNTQQGDWVFAYTRISPTEIRGDTKEERDKEAKRIVHLQEVKIESYCKINLPDKQIIWFSDSLLTGKSIEKRKEFSKMFLRAIAQKPYACIFTKIDRFARSTHDLLDIMDAFDYYDIKVIFVEQNIDTTNAYGKLFLTMLGAMAEFEAFLIRERTTVGKLAKKEEMAKTGIGWGRPKGLIKDNVTGLMVQLDEQKILELHEKGHSYQDLAEQFHCSIRPIIRIVNPTMASFRKKYKKPTPTRDLRIQGLSNAFKKNLEGEVLW